MTHLSAVLQITRVDTVHLRSRPPATYYNSCSPASLSAPFETSTPSVFSCFWGLKVMFLSAPVLLDTKTCFLWRPFVCTINTMELSSPLTTCRINRLVCVMSKACMESVVRKEHLLSVLLKILSSRAWLPGRYIVKEEQTWMPPWACTVYKECVVCLFMKERYSS